MPTRPHRGAREATSTTQATARRDIERDERITETTK